MSIKSPMKGFLFTLQDAQTSGNGEVLAIPSTYTNHKFTIKGSAGVSAGAVQPEAADENDYSGTWAQIGGGPVTVVASTELIVSYQGNLKFIRARISTAVVDGTVTVTYEGN